MVRNRFGKGQRGAAIVEYVILVALIAVGSFCGVRYLGTSLNQAYGGAKEAVATGGCGGEGGCTAKDGEGGSTTCVGPLC
jgi:Flp pilus assembly pilin Flp